ncbi:MAG: Response regulator, LuxR family [Gemmatimonadetes bacterium]|nr:Response regulator, LuxR family [Gemmatimonadota bacterium]
MRVLIVDDHTLVRMGMCLLLETMRGIIVVGEAADGAQAMRLIDERRPDCVLMDLAMPGMNGLDAVRLITVRFPEVRVLVVSMHAEEAYVQQALAAGAAGYLLKGADKAELERALQVVIREQIYLSPAISRAVVDAMARAGESSGVPTPLDALTRRQREVLALVAEGHSTKQVAARLGLSVKTVEAHRGAIMDRLGIRDLAGLVRFAVREGLVGEGGEGFP